ncbi:MAG TPA: MotA/TolQ/ExbB proton channel family protein [Thermoanaerobaculaceae bacterium]|nr:MotA/TolQ/ExbB proton channel family protein [Thermoanaerobaculaceae bacterium]HRS15799.1 MotA/TolQ/ExbB proton channel family protein [Thermoanaerobaculaceae bacterium]
MDMSIGALWASMGLVARLVVILLLLQSVYSLTIAGERFMRYRKAKKESLQFALMTTQYLKQDRPQEAVAASKKFKNSHLARVVAAGLLEFMVEEQSSPLSGYDVIEAARRAIERATLMTTADFKKGLPALATIGATAPFVGLFGTVVGIINAFTGMAVTGSGGLGAVSAGIAEALVATAIGLGVAIPAVWLYNYFLNQVERFQVEMSNSASELVDFFIKKHGGSDAIGSAAR